MTTRGKLARGEHQPEFEGHVQRWVKQLEPLSEGSKVKILKWVPTGDGHCDTCDQCPAMAYRCMQRHSAMTPSLTQ